MSAFPLPRPQPDRYFPGQVRPIEFWLQASWFDSTFPHLSRGKAPDGRAIAVGAIKITRTHSAAPVSQPLTPVNNL